MTRDNHHSCYVHGHMYGDLTSHDGFKQCSACGHVDRSRPNEAADDGWDALPALSDQKKEQT